MTTATSLPPGPPRQTTLRYQFQNYQLTALCEQHDTTSRQKGAHKGAKAAEVEAVSSTGQGGEARVAEEGRAGRAGRFYDVEEISDVVVTNEVERGEG
ncbi:dUTP diphosphatase [Babesia caballi]|uniref:dUTP diphosphatase n=1 Tax=Babesia caballi TaxID=5871 RepID=A0AAV4LSG2_BABCB|nr:dUTP diphosphatase [Babesia caballi]